MVNDIPDKVGAFFDNQWRAFLKVINDERLFGREVRTGISLLVGGWVAMTVYADSESRVSIFARKVVLDNLELRTGVAGFISFLASYIFGPELIYWGVKGIVFYLVIYAMCFACIYTDIIYPISVWMKRRLE